MDQQYPVGLCIKMCPDEEIIRREKLGLLHKLEILPNSTNSQKPKADPNRVVKEFVRSAAGQETQNIYSLRTPTALLETVDYLLHDVVTRTDIPWNVIYDFVMNRLRAVRQDMVIQNLSRPNYISLLQPIVKFYVYAAYRLSEAPIYIFDKHINDIHLQECLKRLLNFYDEMDTLMLKLKNNQITVQYNNLLYSNCRPFMESLYLILNLGNGIAMQRVLRLPEVWKTPLVKKCLKMSLDFWRENYVRVCREIYTLPPLLATSAVLSLPLIRRNTINTMSVAYSCNGKYTFPADTLQHLLLYDNMNQVLDDCMYYGLKCTDKNIIFLRSSFATNKEQLPTKRCKYMDKLLANYNISDLLLEDQYC